MTSTEFATARQRLGWTPLETAIEYNVTPDVIEGFEKGSVRIPKRIARHIRFRSALRERQRVLAASGLPECAVMENLRRDTIGRKDDDLLAAAHAFAAHFKSCALCRERDAYSARHGPPLPDRPMPMFVRIVSWANALLDRLHVAIRPPEPRAGDRDRVRKR